MRGLQSYTDICSVEMRSDRDKFFYAGVWA